MINDLSVYQYDLLEFDLELTDVDGHAYTLDNGESLWFRVKRNFTDEEALIRVDQTDTHFAFSEIDLAPGRYIAETGIVFENGNEYTITQSDLIVKARVREQ